MSDFEHLQLLEELYDLTRLYDEDHPSGINKQRIRELDEEITKLKEKIDGEKN